MNELIKNLSKLKNNDLDNKAVSIHTSLSTGPGSIHFAVTVPTLAEVLADITTYQTALAGSNTALKQSTREALEETLFALAVNLETQADGDIAKLSTTGFDLRKKAVQGEGLVAAPQNLRVKHGPLSGEVLLRCAPVPRASAYEARSTQDLAAAWTEHPPCTSSQRILIPGLQRGKDYYFEVRAIGANGPGPWSDIATLMVV